MSAEGRREPRVAVTDAPDARVEAAIGEGLRRFNAQQSGIDDSRPLAVVVSDPDTNEVLGGITGRTSLGLLFIDLVFLPDELRGDGLGSRILKLAEDEGRRRGCRAAMLYTISFQAPGFYARHGWRVFGEIACDPPGTSRIFMTKSL
ncbi:MAG: GNAT family N-acetyltransferase [Candidatus Rokuibacteriota bacterium]|nr:MAG: GNAT family N-acetyltransferase [Candidatus Rokubacteria bacterium]PYN24854.1 MAG: GNAT family N-acetyltransferase [Candidatus Rokubacteria bacterium]